VLYYDFLLSFHSFDVSTKSRLIWILNFAKDRQRGFATTKGTGVSWDHVDRPQPSPFVEGSATPIMYMCLQRTLADVDLIH
jgi:hypothetical protein